MADVIYMAGTDPWETKSVLFTSWIMGGATPDKRLIFALPRKTTGAAWGEQRGGLFLPVIPGTDVVLHLAIARIILENGWEDREFIDRWVSNQWEIDTGMGRGPRNTPVEWFTTWGRYGVDFAAYRTWLLGYRYAELATASAISGVPPELIRKAAEMLARPRPDGSRPRASFMLEKGVYWCNNLGNTTSFASLGLLCGAGNRPGRMISRGGGHQRGWMGGGSYPRGLSPEKFPGRRKKEIDLDRLFAAIIDQQEFNSFRKVRHIGHKAIRTRSMFDIADWVGWEHAHPYFYVGVPDLCNAPIFHSLYDHAGVLLGTIFKGAQYRLHESNTAPLTEGEQDELIARILAGDPIAVTHAITALLQEGRALTAIADVVTIAHAIHCVERLRSPIAYTVPMHSLDYANVVNFWLRNFRHPHQAKAVYLSAWFVTDTIREVDWYPDDPTVARPDATPHREWAERLSAPEALAELERTIAAQDASRAVALVRAYQQRTAERDPLIRMLVHCAAKFQGDAHIFRNARSVIEEYYQSSASLRRKDVLFQAWAHYLSFYKKRTLSTECYELYLTRMGASP